MLLAGFFLARSGTYSALLTKIVDLQEGFHPAVNSSLITMLRYG